MSPLLGIELLGWQQHQSYSQIRKPKIGFNSDPNHLMLQVHTCPTFCNLGNKNQITTFVSKHFVPYWGSIISVLIVESLKYIYIKLAQLGKSLLSLMIRLNKPGGVFSQSLVFLCWPTAFVFSEERNQR